MVSTLKMMMLPMFQYLIESSIYLTFFLLMYRVCLRKSTHFNWMRAYLLLSLLLSIALPLITLPGGWFHSLPGSESVSRPLNLAFLSPDSASYSGFYKNASLESAQVSFWSIMLVALWGLYVGIALLRLYQLAKKLNGIHRSIRQKQKVKRGRFWLIQLESQVPACSFLNYIFLNKNQACLSTSEREKIFSHETIHAKQWHTLDILITELVSVAFWFNPLMNTFRTYLTEVHEYLADDKTLKNTDMKISYSQLLLKLTTEEPAFNLSSGFSEKLISRRIMMMSKVRSMPLQKLLFLILLPAAIVLLMSFSYLENRSSAAPGYMELSATDSRAVTQAKVGVIRWEGNTLYTDSRLDKELRIKTGDVYSKEYLNERLFLAEDAVNSLYLDKGYLFFHLEVKEVQNNDGTMDLTMSIYEGVQAKIGQIRITGNGSVPKRDILEVLHIKGGELFSKDKLISSVKAISQMNKFDPENILINPIPKQDQFDGEYAVVDIEFQLTEK